jgi:predicted aminopeptidase
MLKYSDHDLVNTIIHEATHSTIFIENNADFNERLASFVGNKGTELFYMELEGPTSPKLATIKSENSDETLFSSFISKELKILELFYKNNTNKDETERQLQFHKIKERFQVEIKPQLKTNLYKNFDSNNLNNASLLLYKTYVEDLDDFDKLYLFTKNNMDAFFEKIRTLEKSKNPADDLKKLLN